MSVRGDHVRETAIAALSTCLAPTACGPVGGAHGVGRVEEADGVRVPARREAGDP